MCALEPVANDSVTSLVLEMPRDVSGTNFPKRVGVHEMTEVEVRCNQCGETRSTYNDVRTRPEAMIECKAKCFETHNRWTFVREIDQGAAPVVASAPASSAGDGSPAQQRPSSSSSSSRASSPKEAFGDAGGQPDAAADEPVKEEEKADDGKCCVVM